MPPRRSLDDLSFFSFCFSIETGEFLPTANIVAPVFRFPTRSLCALVFTELVPLDVPDSVHAVLVQPLVSIRKGNALPLCEREVPLGTLF